MAQLFHALGKVFQMIKLHVAFLGLLFLTAACNDEAKTSDAKLNFDTLSSKSLASDTLPVGCYSQLIGRDTAALQIETKGTHVTGSLSYNIFEKDRNDGTIQADQSGNIIRGWYLFKSEGIISVREVAWQLHGDELWPAIGEIIQRNDTTLFASPGNLKFDSKRPFKKVACVI